MKNFIKSILAIGINSKTSTSESIGKTFFNIDCVFAIISTLLFAVYSLLNNEPAYAVYIPSLVSIIYGIALYFNFQNHYKKVIYFTTFFSYTAIAISSFLAPFYWIPFYFIPLGISFFVYLAHEQKKALQIFSFFTFSAVAFFISSQLLVHNLYYLNNNSSPSFPVLLFFGLFIYKISILIFTYQRIITESKTKEKALKASENNYRIQFENTQLGVIVIDKNFKIIDINPSFCKMIDYPKEEILSLELIENCFKKSPEVIEYFHKLRSAEITHFEINKTFTKRDKSLLITNAYVTGIYDERNNFICSNCSFLDITKKVETEKVLKENKSKYQDIFENMHDTIVILDGEGNITESNAAAKKLFETDDLSTLKVGELIHPEDVQESIKYFNKLREEGSYSGFQGRIIIPGGKTKYLEVDSIAIKDEDNNFIGSRDIARDITDRKLTEFALIANESRYRTLFEKAFEGLMIFNVSTHRWIECNSKVLELFSTDQEKLFNNFFDFFPEFQKDKEPSTTFFQDKLKYVLVNKSALFQCSLQKENGDLVDVEVSAFRIPAPNENLIVSILKDITEKNKQEVVIQDTLKQINQKNEDLQKYIESNMQLENFAYMASHDLKAPLRTITSYIQLIHRRSKHKFDENELEFLDFIIGASKNMGKLIDALLAYSKVDSQEKSFKHFDTETFIYSITQELKTDIEENNITIEVGKMPSIIFADPTRLRQLFQNLISNSIKFKSIDQPPIIKINCIESELDYQFSIEDNGIGIKEEFFDKIFSLFTKLHTSNEYEGTGIGLALCKKIVEQHEGKIWLSSNLGEGTTFYFSVCKSLVDKQDHSKLIGKSIVLS